MADSSETSNPRRAIRPTSRTRGGDQLWPSCIRVCASTEHAAASHSEARRWPLAPVNRWCDNPTRGSITAAIRWANCRRADADQHSPGRPAPQPSGEDLLKAVIVADGIQVEVSVVRARAGRPVARFRTGRKLGRNGWASAALRRCRTKSYVSQSDQISGARPPQSQHPGGKHFINDLECCRKDLRASPSSSSRLPGCSLEEMARDWRVEFFE